MKTYRLKIKEINGKSFDYGISNQLHGYLFESMGSILNHDSSEKEFTQFVKFDNNGTIWILNVCKKELLPYFEVFVNMLLERTILLKKFELEVEAIAEEQIFVKEANQYIINFETPFFFKDKKSSRYFTRFSIKHLYYHINKLNPNINVEELLRDTKIENINILPELINFQRHKYLGMVGQIIISYDGNQAEEFRKGLMELSVKGYGIKTSLGYGGVDIYARNSKL